MKSRYLRPVSSYKYEPSPRANVISGRRVMNINASVDFIMKANHHMSPMKKYKFKAKIEAGKGGGAYVFFPYDVEKEFGTKGRVPVKAKFEGVEYTGSLMTYGFPQHFLGVEKAIREKVGKGPGDMVNVELWKDEEERVVVIPPELLKLLKQEKLLPFFESLSFTHRKEYCRWIREAKKEETRLARLSKAVDMLKRGVKTPG
jgi:hypothetical protein